MNQVHNTEDALLSAPQRQDFPLMHFILVLAKHKKVVIGLPLVLAVLGSAISLALPNVYRAGTRLLPPQQAQSSAAALLSQLGGAGGIAAGAVGMKNPSDLYLGMLKSRTIGDKIISRFNLKKVYETDSLEKARLTLEGNTFLNAGKDGLINIEVEDKNQELVAPLANAYVEELLNLTKVLAVTEAAQRRVFFAAQLEQAKDNLAAAEVNLKGRLDLKGVVSVDATSAAIVETVGRLRAQASAKEIQLRSMEAFVTAQNPEFKRIQEELGSLREELFRLENGRPSKAQQGVSTSSEGLENIKILRDVKYYQMLYELLAKQYEVARLDEAKDAPLIQVLDKAIQPERKFKPKRALIVLTLAVIGLLLGVGIAMLLEAKKVLLQSQQGRLTWNELKSHLRNR